MSADAAVGIDAAGLKWPRFPYPGLRPFQISETADESVIFFGRTENKDDILDRLEASQFVSIVGPSGCGKSSLIKVGVIPVLHAGLLPRAGNKWVTLQMRPGHAPLRNLAEAFNEVDLPGIDNCISLADREALLEEDRSGLWLLLDEAAPAIASAEGPRRVLLLIDQFEEIFSGRQEPRAVDQFVGLITQFFRRPNPNLYIVLTMRTDFIGQCANFPGLAEILNRTQYITPVLRGAALRDAIMRPADAYGGQVEKTLVDEIVRDMGAGSTYDADHLPLMQHALLWLWRRAWQESRAQEPPRPAPGGISGPSLHLTLEEYQAEGGFFGILNHHADSIYWDIERHGERPAEIARAMFQRLTERDTSGRYKRAPARIGEIRMIPNASEDELRQVIAAFRETNFIEFREGYGDGQLVDLSHESLIRQWSRLRDWADEEAEKYLAFSRLAEDALQWDAHGRANGFLKTGGQLDVTLDWFRATRPSPVWAGRYPAPRDGAGTLASVFGLVEQYIEASEEQRDAEVKARRRGRQNRQWAGGLAIAIVVAAATSMYFYEIQTKNEADKRILVERQNSQTQARQDDQVHSLRVLVGREIRRGRPETVIRLTADFFNGERDVVSDAYRELASARERSVIRKVELTDSDFSPDDPFDPDGAWVISKPRDKQLGNQLCLQPVPKVLRSLSDMDCITGITPMRDGKPLEFVGGRWNPNGKQLVLFQKAQAGIWLVPLTISNGAPQGDVAEAFPLSDPPGGHETKLGGAVFNKDGSRIVTGGNDQKLKLWSTAAPGHPLAKQDESDPRHQSAPSSLLSLNADGTILAEGLSDGGANLWTIDERGGTIKFLKTVTLPKDVVTSYSGTFEDYTTRAIAFSPRDPHLLLLAQGYHAGVIDIGTEKPTMRLHAQSLVRTRSVILNLAFSRDGSRIASGDSDGYVHVWRYVPSPSEREIYPDLVPLIGGSDTSVPLYRLGFSASGDQLLTVGRDATVRIFDVRPRFGATQRDPGQSASASDQPLPAIAPKSTGTLTVPTQSGGTITLGRVPSGFEAVAVQEYGDWLAVLPKLAMPAYDGETDNRCRPDSGNKSAGADAANARLCDVLLYRKDQTGEPVVSLEAWPKPTPGEEPVYWRDIKFEKGRDAGCAAVTEACIVATTQNGAKYAWPFEPDPKKLGKELKAAEPLDEPDASEYDYQQCLVVGDCGGYDGLKGAN